MTGAPTGRWTWIVRCPGRSNGWRLARSGKSQKWVGCIITMSCEQHDDMCAHLPIDGRDGFSGPTRGLLADTRMCGHVRCTIGVPRCANLLWIDLAVHDAALALGK